MTLDKLGEVSLDVANDKYKVVPLKDDLVLLNALRYVHIAKQSDSFILSNKELPFGSDKQYIIHYLPASNKLLFVAKDNTLRLLSPTTQGVFILGDLLNDGALRISYQEAMYLLEALQDSNSNWGPDTEESAQQVSFQLQQLIPQVQNSHPKRLAWQEVVISGPYADLEPLLEDVLSQNIEEPDQKNTIQKMFDRLKYNASHHPKHPSESSVVSAAVSPTGEVVVTGASDGTIAIWDLSQTPRLVNTISGPGGLISVLLKDLLITVHQPNTVVVHQIGEHALSEELFQQQLGDDIMVIGAAYVPASQNLVLALVTISSPSRAHYYLQSASIDLNGKALTLRDRVRVEGTFTAISAANGTCSVSVTSEGSVDLFDSSSSSVVGSFKESRPYFEFTDVTLTNSRIYAITEGGTVEFFDPSFTPSADAVSSTPGIDDGFGDFATTPATEATDDFGDFAQSPVTPAKNVDDFGIEQSTYTSPTPPKVFSPRFSLDLEDAPGAGIAGSAPGGNSSTGDFGELPRSGLLSPDSEVRNSPSKLRQSYDPFEHNEPFATSSAQPDFGDFGDFSKPAGSPQPVHSSPSISHAPQFGLDTFDSPQTTRSPIASPHLQNNNNNNNPSPNGSPAQRAPTPSQLTSPDIFTPLSPSLSQNSDFTQPNEFGFDTFPTTSAPQPQPQLQRQQSQQLIDDFGFGSPAEPSSSLPFSTSSLPSASVPPPVSSRSSSTSSLPPMPTHNSASRLPSVSELSSSQPTSSSPANDFSNFGEFSTSPTQNFSEFGEFSSESNFRSPSPSPQHASQDFGDFSPAHMQSSLSQNSTGAGEHPGHSSPFEKSSSQQLPSFVTSTSNNINNTENFGSFGEPSSPFNNEEFGNFGSSTGVQAEEFGAFGAPTSPNHNSQFSSFDEPSPPPISSSQHADFGTFEPAGLLSSVKQPTSPFGEPSSTSTAHFPSFEPVKDTQLNNFGEEFGTFGDAPVAAQSNGFEAYSSTSSVAKPADDFEAFGEQEKTEDDFGAFGEAPKDTGFGGFAESTSAAAKPNDEFGAFGESKPAPNEDDEFGAFGESPSKADDEDEFGAFGESPSKTEHKADEDEFGAFGETTPAPKANDDDEFGAFGENETTSAPKTDDDEFGAFGESVPSKPDDEDESGAFGEKPAATQPDDDQFGAFGEVDDEFGSFGKAPKPSDGDDFGEFTETPAPAAADDFGDFGSFSAPGETAAADDFGDFGDFETTKATTGDDDDEFGDFGSAPPAPVTTAPAPVAAPAPTPTPAVPEPTPQLPSVFSSDHAKTAENLSNLFSTAFSSLVPAPPSPGKSSSDLPPLGLPTSIPENRLPTAWTGLVLPPISEIKFWDALGVPIKQIMTPIEKKPEPAALSRSSDILMPTATVPLTPSTQPTPPTQSNAWDTKGSSGNTPTPSAGSASQAPAPTAKLAQPVTVGHGDLDFLDSFGGPSSAPKSSPFPSTASATTSANPSLSPFPSSSPSASPAITSAPKRANAEDEFFLSFGPATGASAPTQSAHASLLAGVASGAGTSTGGAASKGEQFLSRIPDLSFMLAESLVIPAV